MHPNQWQLIAATFDGSHFHIYSNAENIANGSLTLGSVDPLLQMAPVTEEASHGSLVLEHVNAVQIYRAGVGILKCGDCSHEGQFAGAVGTQQTEYLVADGERKVLQCLDAIRAGLR